MTRVEVTNSGKRSSLLQYEIYYGLQRFIVQASEESQTQIKNVVSVPQRFWSILQVIKLLFDHQIESS